MGVASLVLGILAIIVCWVPCVGWCAIVPGLVGIILGGVGISKAAKKGTGKGCAVAGLVMSIIATAFAIFWVFVIGAGASAVDKVIDAKQAVSEAQSGENGSSAKSTGLGSLSEAVQTAAELNEKVEELKQSKKELGEAWSRLTGKGAGKEAQSELGKAMDDAMGELKKSKQELDGAMDELKKTMNSEAGKAAKEALKGLW